MIDYCEIYTLFDVTHGPSGILADTLFVEVSHLYFPAWYALITSSDELQLDGLLLQRAHQCTYISNGRCILIFQRSWQQMISGIDPPNSAQPLFLGFCKSRVKRKESFEGPRMLL